MFQILTSKHYIFRKLLLLFILLLSTDGYSQDYNQSLFNLLSSDASEKKLWHHPEWLNLLHYNKQNNGYLSQVDDSRFFYAENGKKDPKEELFATLKQLLIQNDNSNQQTQCRFIARTEWLVKQLNINLDQLPEVECNEFLEWYAQTQADSVTMIFPAYHLNSPSSMFGHTLLRLDKSQVSQSEWISYAVNFGADINNSDNSIMYAYRGLAGGYPGIFITEPYFKKIQEYNQIEHRDIWEYKLNLTAEETDRIIKHLWELKTINFDYYFFDENCSYRLLELIEVARPGIELTDEFKITAIPVDTVRAIENAGLIDSIKFRPSRVSQIQYKLTELPQEQQDLVLALSRSISTSSSPEFKLLTPREQKRIVSIAYKYLRYQHSSEKRDPAIAKRSYQLLQLLNSYPADVNIDFAVPEPTSAEKGHKSKRFTISVGERLDNNYIDLGFKMSFHDLEDNSNGFLKGAQINIGTIKIRAEENESLRLSQLELVDIFSLNPRDQFFKSLSWKVNTGFERQLTANKDQLVYQVNGGAGLTWEITNGHQFYSLATLRLEVNNEMKNDIEPAIGFESGILSHFNHQTSHINVSGEKFQNGLYRVRAQLTHNFVLSTNQSVKLFVKQQWQENNTEFTDISLSYQTYF